MAEEVAALATDLARSALEQRVRDSSTGLAGAALEGLYNQGASKLITLYEGSNTPSTNAIVDIVAVHGFGGDPYGTWTADSKLWLRDFLPEDIPNSRILTYGYSVSSGGTISSGNLLHAAQGLLDRLSRLREGKLKRDRPITFICHSLGGLIVIKALLLTEELWQYERLRLATRGIIFLGTPLRISGLQHVNDGVLSLLRIPGLLPAFRAPYSANDNKILSRDSIRYYKNLALLRNLGDDEKEFQKLLQSTDAHINVFSFFETKTTEGIGMAVSKALTNLNNSNVELLPLDANHAELAKFSNCSSDSYQKIKYSIQRTIAGYAMPSKVSSGPTQATEDKDEVDSEPLTIYQYATEKEVPFIMDLGGGIGEGSYGSVYKATSTATGTEEAYAIKQLSRVRGPERRDAVQKEIQNLKRCSHPNVLRLVQVYQIKTNPSVFFLVTRPWAPFTLYDFIMESDVGRTSECPWYIQGSFASEMSIYRIFQGLIDGLAYMHNKAVIKHKDIKPSNILLYNHHLESVRRDETPIIADLGISKIIDEEAPTDFTKSTRKYLAPEQLGLLGKQESTPKADIFALGCCFALTLGVVCAGSAGARSISDAVTQHCEPGPDGVTPLTSGGWDQQGGSGIFAKELTRVLKVLDDLCAGADRSRKLVHHVVKQMLNPDPKERPDINRIGILMHKFDKISYLPINDAVSFPLGSQVSKLSIPPELVAQITENVIKQLRAGELGKSSPLELQLEQHRVMIESKQRHASLCEIGGQTPPSPTELP